MLALLVTQLGLAPAVLADPTSPVSVTKTASKNPVASGEELTYTITMTNLGSSKVDNVVMTDQVNGVGVIQAPPALPQLTITSSKGTCTQGGPNGNVVTCNAGTLSGRQVWTVTIRGQVTAANGTTLNNTASVTGTKSAQTFTSTGSVSVDVRGGTGDDSPLPDLTINKTGPTSVAPSAALTYTLTVNNVGTANTANVRVVDTLPTGVTLGATPFETTSLFTCTASGSDPVTVTCDGGAVNQGQNATIKINAIAPASGTTITNTAAVDPDNTITESNELNNTSASVNTSLQGPAPAPLLAIEKTDNNPTSHAWSTGAGPDPVNPGEHLVYKIQVTNNASSRADDVRISDTTQGLEAASVTVSQVVVDGTVGVGRGCVVNAAEVVCSVRSLNSGGTITVTVRGLVIAPAGSNLFNTATVHGNVRNVGITNTASESTTVRPSIDLTITKADSPDPACARTWPTSNPDQHLANPPATLSAAAGSPTALLAPPVCLGGLTYTFVVGNSGNGNATNVTVRDPLPPGVIFDSYESDGGFSCSLASGNVVLCTGGAVPAAGTRTLTLRMVAPPNTGEITNTVYVDPNNAIFEPDETNNTASASTTVTTGVDLVLWKGDSNEANPPGDGAPTLVPGTGTDLGDGYDAIATRGTQTYTIYVDNVGTQDVSGIRVRDTLPADTIFLSAIADNDHGFTCSHNGAMFGGVVECVGGRLLGTQREFYDPAGSAPAGPGDDFATIKIRVFARATVGKMFNEARVDPLSEIAEVNEQNNVDSEETTVLVGNADKGAYNQLAIEKLQHDPSGDDPVATNGTLVYDLKVSNLGTDPVSAIVAKDTLPSGTRFISSRDTDAGTSLSDAFFCAHDGAATGGVVTCVGGDLSGSINKIPDGVSGDVPAVRTIRVTVYAPPIPGTIINVASVDPTRDVAEGNEFDNDAAEDTVVRACTSVTDCTDTNAFYELKLTKTQANPNPGPVARNGIVTYQLKVENWGSAPVSGVVVTDRLPAGFRFIDAADTGGSSDPDAFTCAAPDGSGVVTCSGGSLEGVVSGTADSRTIEINVFAPDTPGAYTNTAFVDPHQAIPEGNEFNNQSSVVTTVANGGARPFIDLTIDKTQVELPDQDTQSGRVRVAPGGPIYYQLKVTNNGVDGDAFNVRVRDFLPANVEFFKAEDANPGPGAFTCGQLAGQSNTIDCIGGTVPQDGGARTIDVFVVAPTGLDRIATDQGDIRQILTNTANVDPLNEQPEGDEVNNTDAVQTLVQSKVNLTVVSKEGPNTAQQNQTADYVITVKNEKVWGNGAIAFDAVVVDYLPVGLIVLGVSTDTSNMACETHENPVNLVKCVGDIEPDQEVKITVRTFITADGGTLDNEACIDPDRTIDETNELDNCKTKTTQVAPPPEPNLIINKTASTATVTPGESFSYTVTVSNVGDADAPTGITITDVLPTQVTYQSAIGSNGFTCSESSGTVTCSDPGSGLAAGAATVVTIQVKVNAGVTESFTNTASVTGGSETDSASVTTNVGGAPVELILADIEDSPDPVAAGAVVTYTIVVANGGTTDATGLDVTQTFTDATGLTFLTATGSQGFTCSWTSPTVTCTGNLLAGQSTVLTVKFDTDASADPSVSSEVKVDSTDEFAETDEANNVDTEVTTIDADICQGCIDLLMGPIFANPDPVANGDPVTWNFDVTNVGDLPTSADGDADTDEVVIEIDIDTHFNEYSGLAAATVDVPGFTCTVTPRAAGNSDPEIVCTKSAGLGAGEGVIGSVTVTAATSTDPSFLAFDVTVDPGNRVQEFNEANNSGSNVATVDTPPPGP